MRTTTSIREYPTGTEADLSELARDLSLLTRNGLEDPAALDIVSREFLRLSSLAHSCGQRRVSGAARALANIVNRLEQGPLEDVPFILDTAINFLRSIASIGCVRADGPIHSNDLIDSRGSHEPELPGMEMVKA